MKHFRKVWDKEKHDWIFSHKDMSRNEAYKLFCQAFPGVDVSPCGFFNERSRIGAAPKLKHGSTKQCPLYSEHTKKGYVRIKIAQPNVWISKAKWVYMETHPWEDFGERSNYVFLDGNRRNFAPKNIERVPLRLMCVFCNLGGVEPGRPEITKLRIAQAKLKVAMLDAGEKLGLVIDYGNDRRFRTDRNEYAHKYYQKKRGVKC